MGQCMSKGCCFGALWEGPAERARVAQIAGRCWCSGAPGMSAFPLCSMALTPASCLRCDSLQLSDLIVHELLH